MKKLFRKTLVSRLVLSFLGVSVITILIVGYLSYGRARSALESAVYARLNATLELKEEAIDRWLDQKIDDLIFIKSQPEVRRSAALLLSKGDHEGASQAFNVLFGVFQVLFVNMRDFSEIILLSARGGEVIVSSRLGNEGDYRVSDTYFIEGLKGTFIQEIYLSPVFFKPTITVASPFRDDDGSPIGVLAVHLDMDRLDEIVLKRSGLGETGEAYLVDATNTFVAGRMFGRTGYPRGAHSPGIERALEGKTGTGLYRNYAGVPVVGAYRWIEERQLALMAEVYQKEAFGPARTLATQIIVIGCIISLILAGVISLVARRIASPIIAVTKAAERISEGDREVRAPITTEDEIGDLARSFNIMLDEIHESEGKFHTVFDNSPGTIVITRVSDGIICDVNEEFARLTGFSREEAVGKTAFEIGLWRHEDDRKSAIRMIEERGSIDSVEYRFRKMGGEDIAGLLSAAVVSLGDEPHIIFTVEDITGIRQAEKALRESEERYRILFNSGSDAVFVIGIREDGFPGDFYAVNDVACRLLGRTREDLMKMAPMEITTEDSRGSDDGTKELISEILAKKQVIFERNLINIEGIEIPVEINAILLEQYDPQIIIAIARDLTERKRVEAERKKIQTKLILANKMTSMGLMVSSLAHEINNPNNTIMFNLRRFAKTWDDILPILDDYYEEHGDFNVGGVPYSELSEIFPVLVSGTLESSEMIKAIIENLKGFVRQSTDAMDFKVEINDVVRRAVFLLESQVRKGIGRLELDLADDIPSVPGNPQKLIQVMVNLISNSLEALTEDSEMVMISTSAPPEKSVILMRISDQGKGMTPEQVRNATEPFYTTKQESGGTGLGLAITKMLLDEHGATLNIESDPGTGTTVTIQLRTGEEKELA